MAARQLASLPEYVDLTTFLIFIVVFLSVLFYVSLPRSSIPGPFALPLIGNLPLILIKYGGDRSALFSDMRIKYGDVFRLYLGPYLTVVFCGYENMHHAFVKNADKFTDRPNWLPDVKRSHEQSSDGVLGLIWSNGEDWKRLRRFAIQTMRDFGVGKRSLEEVILDEVKTVGDIFKAREGEPINDVKRMMTASTCNIIHHIVFGFRNSHDDQAFLELIKAFEVLFQSSGNFVLSLIPRWLGRQGKRAELIDTSTEQIVQYTRRHVKEHQQSFDENNIRDFIDLYIKSQKAAGDVQLSAMFQVILELFGAGTETTGSTLDWALLYMIAYPEIQKKCYQEIQQMVGSSREVRMSDKSSLHFVEATLLEVQRIANTVEITLPHTCTENTIIGGQNIPKRAVIFGFLTSSHLDAKHWDKADEFRPERFIDQDTGKIIKDEHLVPFSIGPRACAGETMAKMEMFLMFTNLLQKYRFSKYSEDDVINFKGIAGLTTSAHPYRLKVIARQ